MNNILFNADVAVIGAGTMGIGIAQVAAQAGHCVFVYDIAPDAGQKALTALSARLNKRVAAGKADASATAELLARIVPVTTLQALRSCSLVIEAVAERLEIKQSLFCELEAVCSVETVFASNTSSLSITAIASALKHPQRMAGLHFFNPAPLMKLVEIVRGLETAPEVLAALRALALHWDKKPVLCCSTPGFIVNRVARPFYAETLRALEEQIDTPATLDAVLRDAGGFAMGPLQLTDLIGQDVNYAVTESVFRAFYFDTRFQPSLVQQELVLAGHLGRKNGRGFYRYDEGSPVVEATFAPAQTMPLPQQIVLHGDWSSLPGLAQLLSKNASTVMNSGPTSPYACMDKVTFMLSNGKSATRIAAETGNPVVLFDLSVDYANASAIAIGVARQNEERHNAAVIALLQSLGKQVIVLPDYPGLLTLRTVAMLCNEALDVVNKNIASAADTDTAMCYGVNYPLGPLAWGERLGWQTLLQVMDNLNEFYGEPRYRPMPLLRQLAAGFTPADFSLSTGDRAA
ncbi:3-hydroxyacyl-CoA dehydrogenase [Budviciaceae bacterium CWB-B4]|uniref:3-hydroxyacyl-CoA dehydrogenase n=1 Tax=Limnobaculum xujianqingii TaxID=2738837 RepID=A0A9D7FVY0_9GAMM|nr:3-hydroxyacyl-CoA dehydrogenase [Limnobaculum xujianqingii]MBK5074645.1 3-hydroxyacyl-CoA dehydrogenase [Limnobaculum xujianqingii]MBK5178023.1 3-hydroxyacyl-CoA dehydrogenase [Limnobaculum xujianqingii]